MPPPLQDKCALITGSVQGLGLATARTLARAGCRIVLNGLATDEEVHRVRNEIERESGAAVRYFAADLRDPAQIAAMVRDATQEFGAIDILVNNAVVRHRAPIEAFSPAAWDEAVAVNLTAAFHTIRLALPGMKAKGWGRIVNVSSIFGLRGAADRAAYVTTKTALIGLTRAVATETLTLGITCNAVCPGTTTTPVHETAVEALATARGISRGEAERVFLAGKQPTGRFIPAESVAAMIGFLCGPEADDITGAALPIDGGWSTT